MSEEKRLEKTVLNWLGGYIAVGEALTKLRELKGKEFARYVVAQFGITYNRAKLLMYATMIAEKCVIKPANEAVAYRLYRLAKSPGVGEQDALAFWAELVEQNPKPTVPDINAAILAKWTKKTIDRPVPTAMDFVGKAVNSLQEALNLLKENPSPVDLAVVDDLVSQLHKMAVVSAGGSSK